MFNRLLTPLRLLLTQREPAVPTAGDGDIIPPAEGGKAATYASGDADRYRDYQIETALPHIGESLFDVGAGTGDLAARIASRLGSRLDRLVLSHMHPNEVLRLRERFADDQAEVLDLTLPSEVEIARPVDTVLLVNVLGHIGNDEKAIEDLAKVTVPDGRLIIWEAGYSALYSEFDRKAGRVRRYNPASLAKSLRNVGLEIEVCRPINILGGIFCRLMVGRTIDYADPRLVRLYDRLVIPVTRLFDRLPLPFGQNVFCVARVPGARERE
jgi:SAM-dependent methyltransferase